MSEGRCPRGEGGETGREGQVPRLRGIWGSPDSRRPPASAGRPEHPEVSYPWRFPAGGGLRASSLRWRGLLGAGDGRASSLRSLVSPQQ